MSNQATRLAEEAKRLLTVATNAAFDCGEWGDESNAGDDMPERPYKPLLEASEKARQDVIDVIDALLALVQPAVSEEAERAAFEIGVRAQCFPADRFPENDRTHAGQYTHSYVHSAWLIWKAARAQSSSKGDEGMQHE